MKKLSLSLLAFLVAAVVCVGFTSCSSDDDNGGLGLSESQIREYLESGSGTWEVIEVGDEDDYPRTWYFQDGKTNGWSGTMTPYSVKGNLVYIAEKDADNYAGDVLEGGIVITKLTKTTLQFYWVNDKNERYIGTKVEY